MAQEEFVPELDVELSILREEYFGERAEECDCDSDESESESCEEPITHLEMRDVDGKEEAAVERFSSATCGCTKNKGLPCSGYFSEEELVQKRMMMAELDNDQLDCVILGQISAHHYSGEVVGHRTEEEKA